MSVVAVFLAAGLLTACSTEAPPPPDHPVLQPGKPGEGNRTLSPEEAASPVPAEKANQADVDYARRMITHHRQAIEMSALAPDRASAEPVKGIAARIAAAQQPEIEMMNRWLSDNFQPPVDPNHPHDHADMPGMATPAQVDALRAAKGPDFDRAYLDLMIKHHQGAVAMATEVQKSGVDAKIQEMADNVIAEQSDEIDRMRAMLTP